MSLTFYAADRVELTEAFLRIMSSVGQIERNYFSLISEHSDAISRAAMLDIARLRQD